MIRNKNIFDIVSQRFDHKLLLSASVIFISQIPTYYGEDIVNARTNYSSGQRTDFWGGISTLVYAHIPNLGFRWQIWLALIQIAFTYVGLKTLIEFTAKNKIKSLFNHIITYCAFLFSSQMTRDGLMFSLLILGFGLLKNILRKESVTKKIIFPILIVVLAMSFRPWLSIAIIPLLVFFWSNSKYKAYLIPRILVVCLLAIGPMVLELSATKALALKRSFPEQQVMVMDAAASYCYSNNFQTGGKSLDILKEFTNNADFGNYACQLYRPDTWLSLTKNTNFSATNFESDFWLISVNDFKKYESIKSKWINLLLSDPVTYLQNKILFAGKLAIGSDSRYFSLMSANSFQEKIASTFRLPFEILIAVHALSVAAVFMIILIILYFRNRNLKSESIMIDKSYIHIISALFIWICLSSVAYIGSNGRYTYAISILSLILFANPFKNQKEA